MTMSNTGDEKEREERALDALIASAFTDDLCDVDDDGEIERFTEALTEEDRAALQRGSGPEFIRSLFAGEAPKREKKVRGELTTSMNRSDDDAPPTDKAKEEMERKIREAEEKRKEKEEGEKDGGNDGR